MPKQSIGLRDVGDMTEPTGVEEFVKVFQAKFEIHPTELREMGNWWHQELQKALEAQAIQIREEEANEYNKIIERELQKAREEEREETREILRCISRMVEINATNLENYILGQMPITQSELDQPIGNVSQSNLYGHSTTSDQPVQICNGYTKIGKDIYKYQPDAISDKNK